MTDSKKPAAKKAAVKKVAKRAGTRSGATSTRIGTPTVVTELVGGTDLKMLAQVLNNRPLQKLVAIEEGMVEGGAGWLVVWEH